MDILRRIYRNVAGCTINGQTITYAGKSYDSKLPITFPTGKSKEYTLGEVVLYLKHSELSFTEYLEECQKAGISPVNYLDQISIKEDLDSYKVAVVPGSFIMPCYTHNLYYDIPEPSLKINIILINDITSRVHIGNIVKLLKDNVLNTEYTTEPGIKGECSFEKDGKECVVYSNLEEAPSRGWKSISAVILDVGHVSGEEWLSRHSKLPAETAIFSFQSCSPGMVHLNIVENKIQNYSQFWEYINGK